MKNSRYYKRSKARGGFTLIEAVVTMTIIAIIASVVVPSGIGYIENASQSARNKVARSIFLAAQKGMSTENGSGLWNSSGWALMGSRIPGLKADNNDAAASPTPAGSDEASTHNAFDVGENANIRYISIDKNSENKESSTLFMLLDPYIADKSVLEESILIEYNAKTGRVLSAFYSDRINGLRYGSSSGTKDDYYDVVQRSASDLKNGRVGFYGVEDLGISITEADLTSDANVVMSDYDDYVTDGTSKKGYNINGGNNYGLLTVEVLLPENYLKKKIDLTIKGIGEEKLTFMNGGDNNLNQANLEYIKRRKSVKDAVEYSSTNAENSAFQKKYPMFVAQNYNGSGRDLLVLILDCQNPKLGMKNHKDTLGCSELVTTLKVYEDNTSYTTYTSNTVHSMFSEVVSVDNHLRYGVKSVRHLDNLRLFAEQELPNGLSKYDYNKALKIPANANLTNEYYQVNDIYCRNYDNKILNWTPIGVDKPYDESYNAAGAIVGFIGHYMGNGKKIYDLAVNLEKTESVNNNMTGLFTSITSSATIEGIDLDYSERFLSQFKEQLGTSDAPYIFGNYRVGGIAGENWGTISNCTVHGRIGVEGTNSKGVRAGGIVGKNMKYYNFNKGGTITRCRVIADISATNSNKDATSKAYAGGIAGENFGVISYCEVGTGLTTAGEDAAFFGANGKMGATYEGSSNDSCTVKGYWAGGIAAFNKSSAYGDDAIISRCVNAAKVVGGEYAGGIVACQENTCSMLKDVTATTRKIEINTSYNAGTVESTKSAGICSYTNYNSEHNSEKIYIASCYNTGAITGATKGTHVSGGLLYRLTKVVNMEDCYSIGEMGKYADGIYYVAESGAATTQIKNCKTTKTTKYKYKIDNVEISGTVDDDNLKKSTFKEMVNSDKGVGTFEYPYPHFNVVDNTDVNSPITIGENFHRTPWI